MQNAKLSSFYQALRNTGIDYYFTKDTQSLQSHRPVVCAACLVILDKDSQPLTVAQRNILEGMLKVLDLPEQDYCVSWISPQSFKIQDILKYAPYSVLFLGSAFRDLILPAQAGIYGAYSYSPAELEADPKLKRSAFDTLLQLKTQLG